MATNGEYMLDFISIKNFRSIIELALPLNYGEAKAPNGHQEWPTMPFLELKGSRAVPVLGLFGANASGKSNVIQALGALKRLLVGGHSPSLYMPNRLHNGLERTVLEVHGALQDIGVFRYSVNYDATEIQAERLEANGKVIFLQDGKELSFDGLQKRFYEKERLLDIYKVECLNQDGRHTGCILTRIAQNYAGLNATASAVHKALTSHLEVYENNAFSGRDGLRMLIDSLGSGADVQTAFAEIDAMLRKLDLGILRMEYHPELGKDVPDIAEAIRTFHQDESGNEVQFSLVDESMGTRAAFCLLGVCLAALHSGKTLVIDEIDSSLHSLLVAEIIRLFKEKRYNTANAQLVFSAHNTDLLDRELLRVSEVGIVNKNLKHGSVLKRLCDFEGVRNVTNFRKQYLEGRFAGIPFPYL
jgi:hypothetical protein